VIGLLLLSYLCNEIAPLPVFVYVPWLWAVQSYRTDPVNVSPLLPDGVDNSRLGGADYPVNTTSGIVRLCMSNRAVGDGLLQTLCFNVGSDNSVEETEKIGAGNEGTTVATVQRKG